MILFQEVSRIHLYVGGTNKVIFWKIPKIC